MKLLKQTALILFMFSLGNIQAQKSDSFGSTVINDSNRLMRRIPYVVLKSYLGYSDTTMSAVVKNGKKIHYVYIWVPNTTREIGVRMVSPTTNVKISDPIIGDKYIANSSSDDFFEPYITLEKSNASTLEMVSNAKNQTWQILPRNDKEIPSQEDEVNSILRYNSSPIKRKVPPTLQKKNDEIKLDSTKIDSTKIVKVKKIERTRLTRGLYRVGFTSLKDEVEGTFLLQVGFSSKLKGIFMSRTIEGLQKKD